MRSLATIVGLIVVLGAGYVVYQAQLTKSGVTSAPPQQQIDVMGIRAELLTIGQAERQYVVAHGAYGTLDQLQKEGPPSIGAAQRGYVFSVEPNGSRGFTATAAPADPNKPGWPTLVIDETMQISAR